MVGIACLYRHVSSDAFVTGMLQTWVATSGLSARAGILVGSAIHRA